jgi:hypothetical protein
MIEFIVNVGGDLLGCGMENEFSPFPHCLRAENGLSNPEITFDRPFQLN